MKSFVFLTLVAHLPHEAAFADVSEEQISQYFSLQYSDGREVAVSLEGCSLTKRMYSASASKRSEKREVTITDIDLTRVGYVDVENHGANRTAFLYGKKKFVLWGEHQCVEQVQDPEQDDLFQQHCNRLSIMVAPANRATSTMESFISYIDERC